MFTTDSKTKHFIYSDSGISEKIAPLMSRMSSRWIT